MQLSKATSFSSTVVALVAWQVGPSVWVLVSCNDILIHTVHEEGLMLIIIQKDCLPFSIWEKSLKRKTSFCSKYSDHEKQKPLKQENISPRYMLESPVGDYLFELNTYCCQNSLQINKNRIGKADL